MIGRERTPETRVVVTGMGIISPLGITVDTFWDGLVQGRSGVEYITSFDASTYPCVVAGESREFVPENYMQAKQVRRLARFSQMAVAASKDAIEHANLDLEKEDRTMIGVILGNGIGSYPDTEEQAAIFFERGLTRVRSTCQKCSPTWRPRTWRWRSVLRGITTPPSRPAPPAPRPSAMPSRSFDQGAPM